MSKESSQALRNKVTAMAADARYRPFVIGYLLACLDERHWEALCNAAVEFSEGNIARQNEALDRLGGVSEKRG